VILLVLIGFVLGAAGVTLVLRAIVGDVSHESTVRRIAVYGYTHRRGADPAASPRLVVAGFAEAAGRFVAERSRSIRISALRQDLLRAGLHQMTPYKLLGYQAFSALLLPVVAGWLASVAGYSPGVLVFAAILGLVVGWVLPHTLVRRRGRLRLVEIDHQLPDMIDLLVVTVEAGLSFAASLRLAADRMQGPLGEELALVRQEQTLGLATNEALESLLVRVETPSMRAFVRSVLQGETLGVSIGQILRNISSDMRKRRRADAEERAHKAPVKMLFPLIFFIFPSMFVVILVPAVFSFLDALK
jgi:tight adherence protein C